MGNVDNMRDMQRQRQFAQRRERSRLPAGVIMTLTYRAGATAMHLLPRTRRQLRFAAFDFDFINDDISPPSYSDKLFQYRRLTTLPPS